MVVLIKPTYILCFIFFIWCLPAFAQLVLPNQMQFAENLAFEGPVSTLDEHIAVAPILTPNEPVVGEPMFALNEFNFESAASTSERTVFGEHNDDAAWFNDALNQPSSMRSFEDAFPKSSISNDFNTNDFFISNSKPSGNNSDSFWAITSIFGNTQVVNAPLRNTTVGDAPLRNTTVGDAPLRNTTVGDAPLRNTTVRDTKVGKVADVTKQARKDTINLGSGNSSKASGYKAGSPPSKTEEFLLKGNEYYNKKSYVLALKYYELAIDSNSEIAELWFNKGNVLYKMGRFEEAIKAYDKAIILNQKFSKAWKNKGFSLEALGKTIEAEAAFAKARELESS